MKKRMVSLLAVLASAVILGSPVSVKGSTDTGNGGSAEMLSRAANDFKTPETLSVPAGLNVPDEWMNTYFTEWTASTLEQMGANGYFVWQSYVAGLNPIEADSKFTASLSISDGAVRISWDPDLNEVSDLRLYRVEGKTRLTDPDWHRPAREGDHFFRVLVTMPNGTDVSDVPGPIITAPSHKGVQLWAGGPYWAETNVGAENPWDAGYYFWWGDTLGYKYEGDQWVASDGSVSGYEFLDSNTPTYGKDSLTLQEEGWITASGELLLTNDAAYVHWGKGWRMPTDAELEGLVSHTTTKWMATNGVYGRLVTGKDAYSSASIFLPAAGYGCNGWLEGFSTYGNYWSSAAKMGWDASPVYLSFAPSEFNFDCNSLSYDGYSIRPLRVFADSDEGRHYSVHFNNCGGTGKMENMDLVYGDALSSLPECKLTRDGFEFMGWAVKQGGDVVYSDMAEVVDSPPVLDGVANLYAVWVKTSIEIGGHKGVQLWAGGPYWADTNVGAENPEEAGWYFWWGDTLGYKRANNQWVASDGSVSGFEFLENNTLTYGMDYETLQSQGWITTEGNLDPEYSAAEGKLVPEHDAAQANWGNSWRMPTIDEIDELTKNTTAELTTSNGVCGWLVKGKDAYSSASIFLPATGYGSGGDLELPDEEGYYWSSTPEYSPDEALCFNVGGFYLEYQGRNYGLPVRPLSGYRYSLKFNACGGTGNMAEMELLSNSSTNLPPCTIVRDGYMFVGWATEEGYPVAYADCATVRNLTSIPGGVVNLYAVWGKHKGIQLWAGGPYWAESNIGAKSPEDAGYYFWWGDTKGYKRVDGQWVASDGSVSEYEFSDCPTSGKDGGTLQSEGWMDASGELLLTNDAAYVQWGKGWRMPTSAEIEELVNNTTTEWTTINGVYGRLVTGKDAYSSASIFLPAAGYGDGGDLCRDSDSDNSSSYGYYWSSTAEMEWDISMVCLYFYSHSFDINNYGTICNGYSIRPLRVFADSDEGQHYSVHFDACGGTGEMKNMDLVYGDAPSSLSKCTFAKDGFEFVGWALEQGGDPVYSDLAVVAEFPSVLDDVATLYAVWKKAGTDFGGHKGIQLWAGGPYWAEANVGAENPEDAGCYFWWGDTNGYKRVNNQWVASDGSNPENSLFNWGSAPTEGKDIATLQSEGWLTADQNLAPEYDAACSHWKNGWRMPTVEEFGALIQNTVSRPTIMNGVSGMLFEGTGTYSSASIFLPASGLGTGENVEQNGGNGIYWSLTPYENLENGEFKTWVLHCPAGGRPYPWDFYSRSFGLPVRPLLGFSDSGEENHYSLRFNACGGTGEDMADMERVYGGGSTNLPACTFTRDGFKFAGWAMQEDGNVVFADGATVTDFTSYPGGVVNLYAVWGVPYSVHFNNGGGTGSMEPMELVSNSPTNLTACTFAREGYEFVGWATEEDGAVVYADCEEVVNLTSDPGGVVNLYAVWGVPYSVHFNACGGTGSMAPMDLVSNSPTNLPACTFENGNDTFKGWATEVGGAAVYADGAAVLNLTSTSGEIVNLYAVWTIPVAEISGHKGVQLWVGGPFWAETNIGAENPEDYGCYFWWGDTNGYKRVGNQWVASDGSVSGYLFSEKNTSTYGKDKSTLQSEDWITADGDLTSEHDAANIHWGNSWRMPTDTEFWDLIANTTTEWTTRNGVSGWLVKGKGAYSSASIFLPAAGYGDYGTIENSGSQGRYWSSEPYSNSDTYNAYYFYISSDSPYLSDDHRYYGQSVRPILEVAK